MKELLKKLIEAETTSGKGELAAAEVLRGYFVKNNIDCELSRWDETRANITAHVKSSGECKTIVFVCHLDVVPPGEGKWKYPPFSATEKEGRIYGRGSADMKGSTAALATALKEVVESNVELKGDIIVTALAGEETDSCGAKKFIEECGGQLKNVAGIIVAEPTDFEVITAHRGLLWLEVITRGKTAHGSMPQLGINAINSMREFLDELENYNLGDAKDEALGTASMSINAISGGKAINVVPDSCSVKIDMRTLPGQGHGEIISDFKKMFDRLKSANSNFDAGISIVRDVEALMTDNSNNFVREFCEVVGCEKTITAGFCTDGPFFAKLGAPVVIFGPGHGELCHQPDEYIEISDLEKAVEKYTAIIKKFLE
ncbi:MAG: M20 family metallopeptidase [Phycisphaerales bacterium]|jgi:succinyl-diaminopimelate desuccinylase